LIRLLTAVAVAALTAGQAVAHSCVRPDILQTFAVARAAPDSWVFLLCRLDYPKRDKDADAQDMQQPRPHDPPPLPASFTSTSLSEGGFDQPFAGTVSLQPLCFGPWCGGLPGRAKVMIFARVQGDGSYLLPVDPCGSNVFPPPGATQLADLTSCMVGACPAH